MVIILAGPVALFDKHRLFSSSAKLERGIPVPNKAGEGFRSRGTVYLATFEWRGSRMIQVVTIETL